MPNHEALPNTEESLYVYESAREIEAKFRALKDSIPATRHMEPHELSEVFTALAHGSHQVSLHISDVTDEMGIRADLKDAVLEDER